MNNIMTQLIKENTRLRGNEEPSRLHLLLTKELEVIRKVNYQCPLGESNQGEGKQIVHAFTPI